MWPIPPGMVYPAGGGESTGGFRGRPLAGAGWQVAQRRTLAAVFRRLLPPQAGQSQRGRPRGTGPRAARLLAEWSAWRLGIRRRRAGTSV